MGRKHKKRAEKRVQSLRQLLPKRGFDYGDNHAYFSDDNHPGYIVMALMNEWAVETVIRPGMVELSIGSTVCEGRGARPRHRFIRRTRELLVGGRLADRLD